MEWIQKSLDMTEKRLGPTHPQLSRALVSLGQIELARHTPSKAVPLLERALGLRDAESTERAQAQFILAQALWAANQRPRAQTLATLARDTYAKEHDSSMLAEVTGWLQSHHDR
jgi:hypothetical protein